MPRRIGVLAAAVVGSIVMVLAVTAPVKRSLAVHATTLAAPTSVTVTDDDRVARLTWDNYATWGTPLAAGVSGYQVTWSGGTTLVSYPTVDVQPLLPGQSYPVTVKAIDEQGNLGPGTTVTVASNSARVDALRQQMTGFFFDGNDSEVAGYLPGESWVTGYSACDDVNESGSFYNAQDHFHEQAGTSAMQFGYCDRGQTAIRPHASLDLGSPRTIAFDFDGSFGRDKWYADFPSRQMDVVNSVDVGGSGAQPLTNDVRIEIFQNQVDLVSFGADGNPVQLAGVSCGDLRCQGMQMVANVRHSFLVHLSRSSADVTMDGVEIIPPTDFPMPLSYSTAYPIFTDFAYNSNKGQNRGALQHLDNLGWDGPAPSVVTHDYTDGAMAAEGFVHSPATVTVKVPDSLAGATGARVYVTAQAFPNGTAQWAAGDTVSVAGHSFPLPQPVTAPGSTPIDAYLPYTFVVPIDPTTLSTGSVPVTVNAASLPFLDTHIEVDFPSGGPVPAYTQPAAASGMSFMMPVPTLGPSATWTQIGTTSAGATWQFMPNTAGTAFGPVSGSVPCTYAVDEDAELTSLGKLHGVVQVQLLVDGAVVQTLATNAQSPAPRVDGTFTLDTSALSNGVHSIDVVALDAAGVPSLPGYFEHPANPGDHAPAYVTVQNANPHTPTPSPSSTPTASPSATPAVSPTASPTGTPTPQPTNTLTPSPFSPTPSPIPPAFLDCPGSAVTTARGTGTHTVCGG